MSTRYSKRPPIWCRLRRQWEAVRKGKPVLRSIVHLPSRQSNSLPAHAPSKLAPSSPVVHTNCRTACAGRQPLLREWDGTSRALGPSCVWERMKLTLVKRRVYDGKKTLSSSMWSVVLDNTTTKTRRWSWSPPKSNLVLVCQPRCMQ